MTDSAENSSARTLLGLTPSELKGVALSLGLPAYAGKQLARWLYVRGASTFDEMSDLAKASRAALAEHCSVGRAEPLMWQESKDGTKKYLFPTQNGPVECVYIPEGDRATLCVSSQVGCKMGCAFCATGRQGFSGSLTAGEILNQIYSLPERERLTNIVFMGQGEPFDNLDAVLRACDVLTAEWGMAWSPKRITVSSVGLKKGLRRFLDESKCHLAISLHHPIPAERAALMPAERAFGIEQVVETLKQYPFCSKRLAAESPHQRRLSFEYIVFAGLNDSRSHAAALVSLLRDLNCRVNLLRFHSIPDTPLRGASEKALEEYRDYLTRHGLTATIRASRGQDIDAACGLLNTKAKMNQTE